LLPRKVGRKRTTVAAAFAAKLEARSSPASPVDDPACTADGFGNPDEAEAPQPGADSGIPEQEPMPEPRSEIQVGMTRGSSSVAAGGGGGGGGAVSGLDDGLEFEIWVETDLQASWCLEDTGGDGGSQWRESCQTASLRRRWEEFEALGHSGLVSAQTMSLEQALGILGLPEGASAAQLASAFRSLSRTCHPDKVGPSEEFDALVAAYHLAHKSLSGASSPSARK